MSKRPKKPTALETVPVKPKADASGGLQAKAFYWVKVGSDWTEDPGWQPARYRGTDANGEGMWELLGHDEWIGDGPGVGEVTMVAHQILGLDPRWRPAHPPR